MKSCMVLLVLACLICVSQARGQDIGTWQEIAPLHTARTRVAGVIYSETTGKFYAIGGEGPASNWDLAIEEYDVGNNTWTDRAHLIVGVSNSGAAKVGSYIYIPGGLAGPPLSTAQNTMQRFDPAANVVSSFAPMPAANQGHAVVALDNKIYVLGGSATAAAGTTNYIYDVANNVWSNGAAVPTTVVYAAAASDGTYVYLIGGMDAGFSDTTIVQRYNPATDKWNTLAPLSNARGGPGAFYDGERIWAVNGGWATYLKSTEYYLDGIWTAGPDTVNGARTIGAGYSFDKQIAIKAGGFDGTITNKAEKLSIAQPTPTPTPGLTMTLSSSTPAAGSHFTVDVTVQPITETFDAWGMIIKEGGTPSYSFRLSNPGSLYSGARAMATNVHGLPTVYTKTLCSVNIPAGVAGNTYTIIVELVPAGVPLIPIGSYHAEQTVTVH
jgi:N-acetylneuraminic acid mutarotase